MDLLDELGAVLRRVDEGVADRFEDLGSLEEAVESAIVDSGLRVEEDGSFFRLVKRGVHDVGIALSEVLVSGLDVVFDVVDGFVGDFNGAHGGVCAVCHILHQQTHVMVELGHIPPPLQLLIGVFELLPQVVSSQLLFDYVNALRVSDGWVVGFDDSRAVAMAQRSIHAIFLGADPVGTSLIYSESSSG